jgi:hypothetical protein
LQKLFDRGFDLFHGRFETHAAEFAVIFDRPAALRRVYDLILPVSDGEIWFWGSSQRISLSR